MLYLERKRLACSDHGYLPRTSPYSSTYDSNQMQLNLSNTVAIVAYEAWRQAVPGRLIENYCILRLSPIRGVTKINNSRLSSTWPYYENMAKNRISPSMGTLLTTSFSTRSQYRQSPLFRHFPPKPGSHLFINRWRQELVDSRTTLS